VAQVPALWLAIAAKLKNRALDVSVKRKPRHGATMVGASALGTRRTSPFPHPSLAIADAQLAEQARNRDHDSTEALVPESN
jgi:hypothetical protein